MDTKLCILIEISVKIRMTKKIEGSYWSCVTNGEFHFTSQIELEIWLIRQQILPYLDLP